MALKVTHLSVALTIGGNSISLISEGLPNLDETAAEAQKELKARIEAGLTFTTPPGVIMSTSVGEILSWINTNLSATGVTMPEIFSSMTGEDDDSALNGIIINLWDLSLSTKANFAFNLKVNLEESFYTGLGIPDAVTNVFTVDSLGIGMAYNPTSDENAVNDENGDGDE